MDGDRLNYTVDQFCNAANLSKSHFYALQRRGEGPRVTRLGARVVISRPAATKWMEEREAQSVTAVGK